MGQIEANWSVQGMYRFFLLVSIASVIEASHSLIAALATNWVRITGATRGRRGHRTEEGYFCDCSTPPPKSCGSQVPGFLSPRMTENLGAWTRAALDRGRQAGWWGGEEEGWIQKLPGSLEGLIEGASVRLCPTWLRNCINWIFFFTKVCLFQL